MYNLQQIEMKMTRNSTSSKLYVKQNITKLSFEKYCYEKLQNSSVQILTNIIDFFVILILVTDICRRQNISALRKVNNLACGCFILNIYVQSLSVNCEKNKIYKNQRYFKQ